MFPLSFRFRVLSFGLAALLSTANATAADWLAWTGPERLNVADEEGLPADFDVKTGRNVKWEVPLGSVAYGCPTVSDGRIFVGTSGQVMKRDDRFAKFRGGVVVCLEEATGETLWRLASPTRTEGYREGTLMGQQRWGICSSPTVDGNRVYVITNGGELLSLDTQGLANGNDGAFQDEAQFMAGRGKPPVELNKKDADIIWMFDIPSELNVCPHDVASCSVLVHDGVVYASTSNGVGKNHPAGAVNPQAPSFIAVNAKTGEFLAADDVGIGSRMYHAQWCSPTFGRVGKKDMVFVGGGDGWCYAFEAVSKKKRKNTGALDCVWRFDCNPPDFKYRDGKEIPFYNGDVRKHRRAKNKGEDTTGLNANDGTYVGPNQLIATPVFYRDRIYMAIGQDPVHGLGRGMLWCIDATQKGDITESGKLWAYDGLGRTIATLAIHDGLVYATDLAGSLHCVDADTGKLLWRYDTDEETWAGPLVADGKVYFITLRSFTILAPGKEKKILFSSTIGNACAPIAANGVVYSFMKGDLYAFAKGAEKITTADTH
ncbi:PQQ-binding-like beta-propeller repeat protein [Candidatus Hydrogenedentota bacterium]